MTNSGILKFCLIGLYACGWLSAISPTIASSEEPGMPVVSVIEAFMAKQFPNAASRYWIAEVSSETTEEELVLDLRTFVAYKADRNISEQRFMLLVVHGRLQGVQGLPLEDEASCTPEPGEGKSKQL